jgi:hypothetical protein
MFPIFSKFGGQEAALKALSEAREGALHGRQLTSHTLKSWRRKKRIPVAVRYVFILLCEERGISYVDSDFDLERHPQSSGRAA